MYDFKQFKEDWYWNVGVKDRDEYSNSFMFFGLWKDGMEMTYDREEDEIVKVNRVFKEDIFGEKGTNTYEYDFFKWESLEELCRICYPEEFIGDGGELYINVSTSERLKMKEYLLSGLHYMSICCDFDGYSTEIYDTIMKSLDEKYNDMVTLKECLNRLPSSEYGFVSGSISRDRTYTEEDLKGIITILEL